MQGRSTTKVEALVPNFGQRCFQTFRCFQGRTALSFSRSIRLCELESRIDALCRIVSASLLWKVRSINQEVLPLAGQHLGEPPNTPKTEWTWMLNLFGEPPQNTEWTWMSSLFGGDPPVPSTIASYMVDLLFNVEKHL